MALERLASHVSNADTARNVVSRWPNVPSDIRLLLFRSEADQYRGRHGGACPPRR
jgi:hypothetical protein